MIVDVSFEYEGLGVKAKVRLDEKKDEVLELDYDRPEISSRLDKILCEEAIERVRWDKVKESLVVCDCAACQKLQATTIDDMFKDLFDYELGINK